MQPYALTIDKFLDHAAKWSGRREIVTADNGVVTRRCNYADLRERANLLSGALGSIGLRVGDRIGTLAWNTQHHLEMYYATMVVGLVCHTLNPRLTPTHLAAMINEAENRALAVASTLLPLLQDLAPLCPTLEHIIILDGGVLPETLKHLELNIWPLEALLNTHGAAAAWGEFDENTPAGLCYTSGTTGAPKGVLYTHRSNYLHTLRSLQADAFALTRDDNLLVAVPMFHANGWGLPFAAPAVGAKLVLPGRNLDGACLAKLMRDEDVTVASGIQTVWIGVLDHLDATGGELPALKRITIGGSKCPEALIERIEKRFGATVQTSWGMTELSPLGTAAAPDTRANKTSGRPPVGLDLKLTDAAGVTLPTQRGVLGHLKVKGASVIDRYFKAAEVLDREGYFDTGDLAVIDEDGNLTINGRAKDLIKSGGEWINPAEIEEVIGRNPAVALVAVIGQSDEKWGERPVLIVEARQDQRVDPAVLLRSLRGHVADWWIPDAVIQVSSMPLAATGKIDKNRLRANYAAGGAAALGAKR